MVHTAVWKRPAEGPRLVRRLNIDGDGQGDLVSHGGEHRAVFVYQIESYRYWQQQLGRTDFTYGQFGENFTVDGLADDQVCIGDRYRVGEAVFEVAQPRVPCYRVGIRMGDPQIPALLISHPRPGFYLRVLREGAVQAGDEIVQVAAGPEAMTVAEVDALLYLPGHSRQQVLRALRIPGLPDGWKASFRAMLEQPGAGGNAGLAAVSPPPAWPGFRPLAVTTLTSESESVVSVELADPGGAGVPPALPGQFLTLRRPVPARAAPLLRCSSPPGPPPGNGTPSPAAACPRRRGPRWTGPAPARPTPAPPRLSWGGCLPPWPAWVPSPPAAPRRSWAPPLRPRRGSSGRPPARRTS